MRTGVPRPGLRARAAGRPACLALLWLAACAPTPTPAPPPAAAPEAPGAGLPTAAPTLPTSCARIARIDVYKSARTLVAECSEGGDLVFPIALSREPEGPKRARGDSRTPEGEYRVAGPARRSRFHRFIPIDYPSPEDAALGLAEGRIGRSEHDAILRAHAEGRPPPQDTALGGHLGFHGEGERWRGDLDLDWTEGCFALSDDAIEALARAAPPGTPVRIVP